MKNDTTVEEIINILTDPEFPDKNMWIEENFVVSSKNKYCIDNTGMVDFLHIDRENVTTDSKNVSILFKLNNWYNNEFEQRIAHTIFAGGGVGLLVLNKKIRLWLQQVEGIFLDVGCGDQKWKKYMPDNIKYVPIDYLPAVESCPWKDSYPLVNADALKLPFKNGTVDAILNVFVLEHVKSPEILIKEFSRVLKSGGVLLLAGPGDLLMTHGEPHNYFNMTKYAYQLLLEKFEMEIVEEYFPSKFWMSIFNAVYSKIVRNDFYNRTPLHKLFQIPVFIVSLILSPIFNIIAYILDLITPFNKKGYSAYMVLARKK